MFFLIWDGYYTKLGIWGFNEQYITGVFFSALPIEEVLFFFCIPYACLYTYHCVDLFLKSDSGSKAETILTNVLIFACILTGFINLEQAYTAFAFLTLALLLLIAKYFCRVPWLMKFYTVYALLIVPFLIVNGVLTGTGLENPVVWYNNEEIFGFRILTIPFEDIFYGMSMILMNLLIYKYLLNKLALWSDSNSI
jgi:lycopene cyclase domain-containing protein